MNGRLLEKSLVLFVLTTVFAASTCFGQTILMVTDSGSLNAEETARRNQLQSWGFTVTTVTDSAAQGTIDSAVAAASAVYVPLTVSDSDLSTKLRTAAIGVVYEKATLDDDFGLSTSAGSAASATDITIASNSHPITNSFSTGTITIFTVATQRIHLQGTLAAGLTTLATDGGTATTLGVVETGGALANTVSSNSTATGRRVRLPWGNTGFAFSSLNGNGLAILLRSLQWAVGNRLLLHYRLDETSGNSATDSSGNGHTGTVTGTSTWVSAVRNNGFDFNGTTKIQTNSELGSPVNVSMAAWVELDAPDSSGAEIASIGDHVNFRLTANSIRAVLYNGSSWLTTSATFAPVGTGWHHYAFTFDDANNELKIYIDGVLVTTTTVTVSINYSGHGTATVVGRHGNGSAIYDMDGRIDDVRIYNYALSQGEISELFGLVAHWALSEGAGTTTADSSGIGANATVNGATWTSDCSGNTAIHFDGVNDTVAMTTTFDPPSKGAVSFWFRSEGTPTSLQRLWGLNSNFEMWQGPDGYVSCNVSTDGLQGGLITTTRLDTADQWYHLVAEYDSDTDAYAIYIDGQLHKSGISTWAVTDQSAGILTIGTRTGASEYFKGTIRDFRIYNRPMFPAEISSTSGILARWQLNESSGTVADDLSVAGNDATFVGNPTLGVSGSNTTTNGTAVELNGTSQYLSAGKSLLNGVKKFTLAAWVRPDNVTPDKSFLGQNGLIELGIDSSSNQIDLWTNAGGSLVANAALPISQWSHVVAVGNGTSLKIYVNGIEVGSGGSATASYGSNSAIFKVGEGVLTSSGHYFDGAFDDVRVYNRALCPDEIDAIYQGGQPATGVRIIRWVETR